MSNENAFTNGLLSKNKDVRNAFKQKLFDQDPNNEILLSKKTKYFYNKIQKEIEIVKYYFGEDYDEIILNKPIFYDTSYSMMGLFYKTANDYLQFNYLSNRTMEPYEFDKQLSGICIIEFPGMTFNQMKCNLIHVCT